MLIKQAPTKLVIKTYKCDYHKRNPGKSFAGCTCGTAYSHEVKPISEWTDEEKRHYFGDY